MRKPESIQRDYGRKRSAVWMLVLSTVVWFFNETVALANPQGGQVVGGSAAISGEGSSQVNINQATDRAIINWNSFSIGQNEGTTFHQPDSHSVALNRVTGADPSAILGSLTANGTITLANPNGIL